MLKAIIQNFSTYDVICGCKYNILTYVHIHYMYMYPVHKCQETLEKDDEHEHINMNSTEDFLWSINCLEMELQKYQ